MVSPPLPEWAPHEAVWIGFPSDAELWLDDLKPAQEEVAAFALSVWAGRKGEEVRLVAADHMAATRAKALAPFATVVTEPFGDIWLRDTGPIILSSASERYAVDFAFNGWGGKYRLQGDDDIGARLARGSGLPVISRGWILEGGAIEGDGTGLCITTEQCLLNPNRNAEMGKAQIEEALTLDLGFTRVIWLGDGLANDHTDGHVDNLARFVAPGRVAIPTAAGETDPNCAAYTDAARRLAEAGVDITTLPSPGRIERDGEVIPASYMNFYIGNAAVVVPQYGVANDAPAIAAIQALFPERFAVGHRADHILTGGGSFHCISQQVPQ